MNINKIKNIIKNNLLHVSNIKIIILTKNLKYNIINNKNITLDEFCKLLSNVSYEDLLEMLKKKQKVFFDINNKLTDKELCVIYILYDISEIINYENYNFMKDENESNYVHKLPKKYSSVSHGNIIIIDYITSNSKEYCKNVKDIPEEYCNNIQMASNKFIDISKKILQ